MHWKVWEWLHYAITPIILPISLFLYWFPTVLIHTSPPQLFKVPSGASALWSEKSPCSYYRFQECSPYLLASVESCSLLEQPPVMVDQTNICLPWDRPLSSFSPSPSCKISYSFEAHALVNPPVPSSSFKSVVPGSAWATSKSVVVANIQAPQFLDHLITNDFLLCPLLLISTVTLRTFALWNCFPSHITNISIPFPNHKFLRYSWLGPAFPLWSVSDLFGIPQPKSSPLTLFMLSTPWFLTQLWSDGLSLQSVSCDYLPLPCFFLSLLWSNPTWLTSNIDTSHIE